MTRNEHTVEIQIREHHLDFMGHVNNAAYLEILEEARWDLITERGYGLDKVHRLGVGPVVLECTLKFKKELKNREFILIKSHFLGQEGKIGRMKQTIFNKNGDVCCAADFVFGLFNLKTRKLVEATPEWLAAIE